MDLEARKSIPIIVLTYTQGCPITLVKEKNSKVNKRCINTT